MSELDNIADKAKGRFKQAAGEVLDDEDLQQEGEAQEEKAEAREDAERLEELAEEKRDKAAGYKGQEKSKA